MLLRENSPLYKVPSNLNARQSFLLEGIRYCLGVISLSYDSLLNNLETLSNDNTDPKLFYAVTKDVYNLVDWIDKFVQFIVVFDSKDGKSGKSTLQSLTRLKGIRGMRNTFHHLDERIDEMMLEINASVWGSVSWLKIVEQNKIRVFAIQLGNYKQNPIRMPMFPKVLQPNSFQIYNILLSSVEKLDKQPKVVEVEVDSLYNDVITILSILEQKMEEAFNQFEDKQYYLSDYCLSLEVHLTQQP